MDWFAENAERNLWFKQEVGEGWNCYFFPKDWAQEFSQPGFCGNDEDSDDPELYGYAPSRTYANSEVETLYIPMSFFKKYNLIETTEEEALVLHPRLAEYLDEINREAT